MWSNHTRIVWYNTKIAYEIYIAYKSCNKMIYSITVFGLFSVFIWDRLGCWFHSHFCKRFFKEWFMNLLLQKTYVNNDNMEYIERSCSTYCKDGRKYQTDYGEGIDHCCEGQLCNASNHIRYEPFMVASIVLFALVKHLF